MTSAGATRASAVPAAKRPTEELIDVYLYRPLAAYVVRLALPLRVTPNQVTLASVLAGGLAGWLFAERALWALVAGVAAAFAAMVFDCADGQLARARGGGSSAGRILDGLGDYVVAFAVHLGALYYLFKGGGIYTLGPHHLGRPELFFIMLGAGFSMAVQCALYDFYKHRYLGYLGHDYRGSIETPEAVDAEIAKATSAFDRGLLHVLRFYVSRQAALLPRKNLDEATLDPSSEEAKRFVRANEPFVRAWSFLGPSGHHTLICLGALLSFWRTDGFLIYALFTLIVENGYMLVLLALQGRATRLMEASPSALVARR